MLKTKNSRLAAILVVGGVVVIGLILLALTRAATPFLAVEPEAGTLSSTSLKQSDSAASGGSFIKFGSGGSTTPSPTPPPPTPQPEPGTGTYPIRATADKRYFVTTDGKPFLYLADTIWLGSVKLTQAEWEYALDKRKSQGYNTIQVSIPGFFRSSTSMFDATLGYTNRYGDVPFNNLNLASPKEVGARTHNASSSDYDFWDHIDWMTDAAAARGMMLNYTAAWYGYAGEDWRPYVNDSNATAYGTFLGKRLGHKPNIMWTMGGDNNPGNDVGHIPSGQDRSDKTQATRNMANAIRANESVPHLMSYHTKRRFLSNDFFASDPWHTMAYSYADEYTHVYVGKDYNRTSNIKPIVMPESYYDDWTYGGVAIGDRRLRAQAYNTYLNGGVGFAYGHRSIWTVRSNWKTSMDANSANDMKRLSTLFAEFNNNKMVPDHRTGNTTKMLSSGYGSSTSLSYSTSARASDKSYGLAYFPSSRSDIVVNLGSFSGGNIKLYWWNPATGAAKTLIGTYPGSGTKSLSWPSGYSDAVLVAIKS